MIHKKWWVQGVILDDQGGERGRYALVRFWTRAAARRFVQRLYRDNTYPFQVDTNAVRRPVPALALRDNRRWR